MYIINPWWFYFIGVTGTIQTFFWAIGIFGLLSICVIGFVFMVDGDKIKFPMKTLSIIFAIMILIGTLIPNKETCYAMAIASVATTENLDYATETGKNIVDYITEKAIELIKAGE